MSGIVTSINEELFWEYEPDDSDDEFDYYGIKRPEERDEWDDLWADRAREVGATLF